MGTGIKMKLLFILLFFAGHAYSTVCTTISRTDLSSGSVLTSTKYNGDLNTAYTALNSISGGCVSAGTLGAASLDATEFDVPLKAIQRGCDLSYKDSLSAYINECRASVNGNFVSKDTQTEVTWAQLDAGTEATGSFYYVYIATGSSGSTVTPVVSLVAPNNDGYNAGGDFSIGRFYNDAQGNIATGTIEQFSELSKPKNFSALLKKINTYQVGSDLYNSYIPYVVTGVHALDGLSCIFDDPISPTKLMCDWVEGAWVNVPNCSVTFAKSGVGFPPTHYILWHHDYVPYTSYGAAKQSGTYNDFEINGYRLEIGAVEVEAFSNFSHSADIYISCHGY